MVQRGLTAAMAALSAAACCLSDLPSPTGAAATDRPMGVVIQSSRPAAASSAADNGADVPTAAAAPALPSAAAGRPRASPSSPEDAEAESRAAGASACEPEPGGQGSVHKMTVRQRASCYKPQLMLAQPHQTRCMRAPCLRLCFR
jgi:hypothetical protein